MIPAKSEVFAFGQRAVPVPELLALDVPEVCIIGGCYLPGRTKGAIFDGYYAAMDM